MLVRLIGPHRIELQPNGSAFQIHWLQDVVKGQFQTIVVDLLAEQEAAIPVTERKLKTETKSKKVQVLGGLV